MDYFRRHSKTSLNRIPYRLCATIDVLQLLLTSKNFPRLKKDSLLLSPYLVYTGSNGNYTSKY